jgi:Cys-rich repeat protein
MSMRSFAFLPRFLLPAFTTLAALGALQCGGSSDQTFAGAPATGGSAGAMQGPACASDATCMRPTPYCDLTGGHCVQCVGDANCNNGICDLGTHSCVECATDAQCGMGAPYCSPAHACVTCLTNSNCMTGQVCDTVGYRCVASCTTDTQCNFGAPRCDTASSRCVQCLASADCTGGMTGGGPAGTTCDTATHRCVQCLTTTDCAMNQNAPLCDSMTNRCVECVADTDCMMGQTCTFGRCQG